MANGEILTQIVEDAALCAPDVSGKKPVWSEEFDHGTAPDQNTWSYDLGDGGWGNRELQTYTNKPDNIRVEDSQLVITARKKGKLFTSARIKTEGKFCFKYGMIEARARIPDLRNGLWPAVWALGSSFPRVGWPASGEIILMEMGVEGAVEAGLANQRIFSAAHWEKDGIHETAGSVLDHPYDLSASFHRYRMNWTPTDITTYIDDLPIWKLDVSEISQFQEPHYLLLNMAIGGELTGIIHPDGITASLPAEYRVDYIRIFDNGHTVLGV
jgi:beta-glucanase (GH16 family)